MSIPGILAALVIFALGAAWLVMPIIRRERGLGEVALNEQKQYDALVTTYERILTTIRDLDEDYTIGKLSPDEYQQERALWSERGVEALKALEANNAGKLKRQKRQPIPAESQRVTAQAPAADADAVLDDAIEQAIASYIRAKDNSK